MSLDEWPRLRGGGGSPRRPPYEADPPETCLRFLPRIVYTRLIRRRVALTKSRRSHSCVQDGRRRPQRADPGHREGLPETWSTSISCRWAVSPSAPFPALSHLLRMRGRIHVCQGAPNGFWQQPGAPTYPPHSTSPALKPGVTFLCSVSGAGRFGSSSQPDLRGGAGEALVVKIHYK